MRNPFSHTTAQGEKQGLNAPTPNHCNNPFFQAMVPATDKPLPNEKPHPPSPGDLPPPSYDESRSSQERPAPQQQPSQQSQQHHHPPPPQQPRYFLPTEWCLFGGGFMETTLMLAENPARPIYAVSQHSGWSGSPDVVLHCGPDPSMPALASAEKGFSTMGANQIVLPALHPFGGPGSNNNGGGSMAVVTEELVNQSGWTPNMAFSIEVGHLDPTGRSPPPQREWFEWRHSRGDAVLDLDAGSSYGYKLVRLSTRPPPGVDPGAAQFVGGGYMTSSGEEVVAVFARIPASMSRRMKFRFLGTGASGLLGDRWALMAAVTAIRIWQREARNRR
ncbi:hypothetical protein Micbo1qcDRAFT_198562 [Microdochium bolleyi]|uniref:Uncharacterized protein n=1 Tax=Microdochium bolleyi TaxID=196109 RepID=A0A136IM98_9PEZI|nr:hypothetical protein Micbo1qcDRAFT_198562 [Microdochium bolleyi]